MSASLKTPQVNSNSFDPAPAGWSVARCFAIIDLGTHYDQKWDKETHMVRIGFELPNALRDDGKPFAIYCRYTLSHHEKSRLRKDLEAWYGKRFDTNDLNRVGGFDLGKLIGRAAFVNVTHTEDGDNTYANIASIGPLPKDTKCPDAFNDPVVFSLTDFDQAVFDKLTDKTKEQIQKSVEWQKLNAPETGGRAGAKSFADIESDIPFINIGRGISGHSI